MNLVKQITPSIHLVIMSNVNRWRKAKGLKMQPQHFRNEPRFIRKPVIDVQAKVEVHP